ncbi:acetyl esterase [Pseudonocardia thermophila]|uniref:Acetyl esterase n=1 Tax=Pseudonocardia thermophila TaxID=1848 RepID=A0A1M6WR56_PSETH|nr:alpha/beta hydrolase [Pseudonocardia thermophila]SHK96198.1 acetyl esterase [Pseudonocardia thermophila]
MGIDPEVAAILTAKGTSSAPPLETLGVAEARTVSGVLRPGQDPGPSAARELVREVAGTDRTMLVLEVDPAPPAVVLWVHGGGWVLGSAAASLPFARRLAAAWSADVAVIDYRLAPEHPYPAAIDDVTAAWRSIARACPGRRIVLAGDSAGANLALAAVARQPDTARADAVVAFYPAVDPERAAPSHRDPDCQVVLPTSTMGWFWQLYAPGGDAYWSTPLRWDPVPPLPRTVVVTAEFDVLRDEGQALAEHLRAGGVDVDHRCWSGQVHGFVTLNPAPASAAAALAWSARQVAGVLTG